MPLVHTRSRKGGTFTAQWIDGGGIALAVEPDPNTVSLATVLASGRTFEIPKHVFNWPGVRMFVYALDGTTCTVRTWFYDDVEACWIPSGTTGAATPDSGTVPANTPFVGPKWYLQIVANTGVTKIAIMVG